MFKMVKFAGSVCSVAVLVAGLVVGHSAAAGTIIAETASGTLPTALSPTMVNPGDYVGIPFATLAGPDIIVAAANHYTTDMYVKFILTISGASIDLSSFNYSDIGSVQVANLNGDGTIGTFRAPSNMSSAPPGYVGPNYGVMGTLATQAQIYLNDDFQFLDISNIVFTALGGLMTPGASITLAGSIVNAIDTTQVFETITPTVVVISAVPAPSALLLLVCGVVGMVSYRHRLRAAVA
jgi:hypothetical protein